MDVVFREATESDYDGIKDLSKDIYGTTDTLLHSLFDLLESVRWFLFVGEIDKSRIIAFTAIQVTDGMESLNERHSRVDKEYRGRGFYKDLIRYAVQHVRERVQGARYIYRFRTAEVRVPNGFDVIKKRGLVKIYASCDDWDIRRNYDVTPQHSQNLSWNEFKALCDSSNVAKDLLGNEIMEIHCDIFNLKRQESWKCLENRSEVNIMLTECKAKDGSSEVMISLLSLEKEFTRDGTPMFAMNLYGMNKDALRCHIIERFLEVNKHSGGGKVLLMIWMEMDVMQECLEFLKELPGSDIHAALKMNLLRGDFNKNLEAL